MTILNSLQTESVQLQNRIGRLISVNLQCFLYDGRYWVILQSSPEFPARQMSKSAEHLAHQLVQRLGVNPDSVEFLQCQPGETPEWLRWSFTWVGQSPLNGKNSAVKGTFEKRVLQPILEEGQAFSIKSDSIPQVA